MPEESWREALVRSAEVYGLLEILANNEEIAILDRIEGLTLEPLSTRMLVILRERS